MRLYLFRQWCYFIRKSAPVSYRYSFEDLLALLHGHAPAKVDAVALHRRRVEHGHLSVGLKIHCLGDGSQFSTLVEGLGGAQKILDVNYYKHSHASLCLVLPPVGSPPARSRRSRVIRAHQPGSEPIDIPETIPNPVVVPEPTPTPTEPAPKEPVRIPEKVP